jgi:nicotinate phosphoribosyltransferase
MLESGKAMRELIGSPSSGRDLQVDLMLEGVSKIQDQRAALLSAREHHAAALAELPASALRLSKGEPAIPSEFV